jgi:hypothetical protein
VSETAILGQPRKQFDLAVNRSSRDRVNQEVLHRGAEIALLRDLYRAT